MYCPIVRPTLLLVPYNEIVLTDVADYDFYFGSKREYLLTKLLVLLSSQIEHKIMVGVLARPKAFAFTTVYKATLALLSCAF